ncbi:unnamed protein product [Dicrocoelium dendriticum]|nr:unnamed protein product [Dicrocoelium dendriticum]
MNLKFRSVQRNKTECEHLVNGSSSGNALIYHIPPRNLRNFFCNYVINVTGKTQVSLRFADDGLQATGKEVANYLVMFDGPDCMAERSTIIFDGDSAPYLTKGNVLTALFISTSVNAKERITNRYTQKQCGSDVKGSSGIISQIRDGKSKLFCIWRITVDHGNKVNMRVTSWLFLYPDSWIRILDGSTCAADEGLYVTSNGNEAVTLEYLSTTNTLMLVAGSSTAQPGDLFKASYTSVSTTTESDVIGQTNTETGNETILSSEFPQNYCGGAFCNYAINVTAKAQIRIKFTESKLGIYGDEIGEYILLFDGPDCMATRMAVVTEKDDTIHITKGNTLTALVITDEQAPRGIFKAEYVEGNCGAEIIGNNGIISRKGGSKGSTLCIWRITVDVGRKIKIRLREWSYLLSGSWIRILDGSTCGANELLYITSNYEELPKEEFISTSNTLMVVFAHSVAEPEDLFEASYKSEVHSKTEQVWSSVTFTTQTARLSTLAATSASLQPVIIVGICATVTAIRILHTET